MNSMSKNGFLMIAFSVLAGCASVPPVAFVGSTATDQQLKNDVYKMLARYTDALGCKKIEKVHTEITQRPSGSAKRFTAKERWLLFGCQQQFAYDLAFQGDGVGGTSFSIIKE